MSKAERSCCATMIPAALARPPQPLMMARLSVFHIHEVRASARP
jgi:hypothetical protein